MYWKHKENANGKKKKKKKKLLVLKKEDWVKKRITGLLKKLNTELAYDPEIPLQIYTQKKWKHMSTQKLDMNVYSSVIRNIQKVQTTQMSMNRGMGKQMVVYPSSGMLFSHEKKEVLKWAATWMDVNVTWSLKGTGGCQGDETVLKPEMVAVIHERTKIALSGYTLKPLLYATWISP